MTGPLDSIPVIDIVLIAALLPAAVTALQQIKWEKKSTPWTARAVRGSLFARCARCCNNVGGKCHQGQHTVLLQPVMQTPAATGAFPVASPPWTLRPTDIAKPG